jgi:hypothetical protein
MTGRGHATRDQRLRNTKVVNACERVRCRSVRKAPSGAKSVWAVIDGEPTFKDDRPCRDCMTGEASDPMLSAGCVCLPLALAK